MKPILTILTIVRGLPGSGKSSYARRLSAETGAMLIEPDALIVRGGVYCYDHRFFLTACDFSLDILRKIAETGADAIYADVLATKEYVNDVINAYWDGNLGAFVYGARVHGACGGSRDGFTIVVHDMPLLTVEESIARNRHHVRREDIEHMAREWEPWKESVK